MLLMDRNLFCYIISKQGPNSEISHIWKVYRIFNFHPILMHFILWIDCVHSFQWYVNIFFLYIPVLEINSTESFELSLSPPSLKQVLPNDDHKYILLFYFEKGCTRDPNSFILHIKYPNIQNTVGPANYCLFHITVFSKILCAAIDCVKHNIEASLVLIIHQFLQLSVVDMMLSYHASFCVAPLF